MFQRPPFPRINPLAPLAKGLVFAALGGGAGTNKMVDASPWGNHGTLTNMTPLTDWVYDPKLRWGQDYDGSDDQIIMPLPVAAYPFTMSAWIKTTVLTDVMTILCIDNGAASTSNFHRLFVHGAVGGDPVGAQSQIGTGGFVQSTTGLTSGKWHHVLGVWASATSRTIYLDGGSSASNTTSVVFGTQLYLRTARSMGNSSYYEPFTGQISDTCAWNRALSLPEISALADPSNVMLSGLIVPQRRRLIAVGAVVAAGSSRRRRLLSGVS